VAAEGAGRSTIPAQNAPAELTRPVIIEALGTGILAFVIVAAGILAERFSIHNIGLAMLVTALAGAAIFFVLARIFGPSASAVFNPGIALVLVLGRRLTLVGAAIASAAQIGSALLGVLLAHMVTNTGAVQAATQLQTGEGVWIGEFIGTALFAFAILAVSSRAPDQVPLTGALALFAIALATPSMSFANPALTLARALTDSFTSIRLEDAAVIAGIQLAAAVAAWLLHRWLMVSKV
jgi:glycerol uptake facilitator-like aquaporin